MGSDGDISEWLGPGDLPLEQLQVYSLEEEVEEGEKGEGEGKHEDITEQERVHKDCHLESGNGLDDEAILARVAEEMDLHFPIDNVVDKTHPPPKDLCVDDSCGPSVYNPGHSPVLSSQEEDLLFDAAYNAYESGLKRIHLS